MNHKIKQSGKTAMALLLIVVMLIIPVQPTKAQLPVTDVANITQSIVNSVNNIAHTSTTAVNMVKNFQETVKIYNQAKGYYDDLKKVHNLVKDARKVQKSILLVGDISELYISNFQSMMSDPNYSVEELSAIAFGYSTMIQESTDLLSELKDVVNINGLSMTDRERMETIDWVYTALKDQRDLVSYYTRKNIAISYLRAKKIGDSERVVKLYGNPDEKYW